MKALRLNPAASRIVIFHGIHVDLLLGERFLAVDADGSLWAYYAMPRLSSYDVERGQWSIERGDRLPRQVGVVDLEGADWQKSMDDFGVDPKLP